MTKRSASGLREALNRLVQTNRRGRCTGMLHSRGADISDLFLAELRETRARLARLVRLLEQEVRRGGAAPPSGHHRKGRVP